MAPPNTADDLLDDPEPEPDAAEVPARGGALEPAEDPIVVARGDPEPAIPNDQPAPCPPSARTVTSIGLPSPYLTAFESRLLTTCSSRSRSQWPTASLARVDDQRAAEARRLVDEPRAHLARQRGQVDRPDVQLEVAGRQPRDVEQIVDEARAAASPARRSARPWR